MRRSAPNDLGNDASSLILFTQIFPFGRGEEFLEAEIVQLVEVFDRVVVVPTLWASGIRQTRQLPAGASVVTGRATGGSLAAAVVRFCARHPLQALRSFRRAMSAGPNPRFIMEDWKFDVRALEIAERVVPQIANLVSTDADIAFYAFWLHMPARVAIETIRLMGLDEIPIVSRANGFDLYVERAPHHHLPQRELLLSELNHVFAASESAERYLRERYPEHRMKYSTDRIGTTPAIGAGNANRSSLHLVSCSYIAPVKRLRMLIDDLAEAQKATGLQLTWTHIGSGTGDHTKDVMAHAENVLAPGSYRFAGHMESRQLREWYAENPAAAFLQMSESEGGLAASIQEALAQGLPVIATNVGGVGVLRKDPDLFPGLLDPSHTPNDFVDRLQELLGSDDATYARYVRASMDYWRAHCSAEVLSRALAHRLRRIARRPSQNPQGRYRA
ncbi:MULTISPECIES: glycosyltransferase [Microbacterium]|uniref:glycosyltransferase n=1 Tax=Microbacterium TaxID=33882 RepID=UPI0028E4EBFE|nr:MULTISPECIES: glycosyltransferase [Microbacterium]